ncbi:PepSY-associated TM helix domain-containing protein [Coraliomargarita sp. SDUM461004]|uniref:PepSY-associated TM helix domain-containing protein n=1 Tax=Thalassobacterium sedimentorum TaxID=3041258 RepID=A0ABU1AL52_9BACT|nr:PepSY-associated TM helix domain-containing protein [Coraliomargarita sp. SDUM461004]MDQ8195536.1 PepSY-associated TM helix domain-containing protein [Coraliomargarita sp. SDUM461004]|tara:strand:- start:752 stop:1363 length:612 start_codon:yes stop_codon:yes gene_type:complete
MKAKKRRWKAQLTKQLYLWHWVSSAIALVGMLLFAFTGITLNHAGSIGSEPEVYEQDALLPSELQADLAAATDSLPYSVVRWIEEEFDLSVAHQSSEWSEYEIYVSLPRPGGDAWLLIDRESGEVMYERSTRGMIAYLNDLHKGRNTGFAWFVFLDVFSVATIIFCMTGFFLLLVHAKRRPSTWPLIISGFLLPFILIIFFVH